ncbi:hypothetical protein [Aquibium microcysteis]|nr:hypothetical protein [Aquibium microcysteis]
MLHCNGRIHTAINAAREAMPKQRGGVYEPETMRCSPTRGVKKFTEHS